MSLSALVLLLGVCASGGICGDTNIGPEITEGHVYIDELMKGHPLYPQLLRLRKAIQSLRPETDAASASNAKDGQDDAERAVGFAPSGDAFLADVEARLNWSSAGAQRKARAELLKAESQVSRELAAEVYRRYTDNQERLVGEGLEGTEEAREAVRAELEAGIDRLRNRYRDRLAELEARLRATVDWQVAETGGAIWEEATRRSTVPARALAIQAEAAVITQDEYAPNQEQRIQALLRQAQILEERCREIDRRIRGATKLCAQSVARQLGLTLYFPPTGEARGPDLTGTGAILDGMRDLWGREGHHLPQEER